MEQLLPNDIYADVELRQLAAEQLNALLKIEPFLPTIVIIHDIRDWSVVYMSSNGLSILGLTLDQIRNMAADYHQRFFNQDDSKDYVPKIFGLLERNSDREMVSYFQQVRPSEKHEWTWYASCSKIFLRGHDNKPLLTITTATPIDQKHYINAKVERILQERAFLETNQHQFQALTNREKQILRLLAKGLSSQDIAKTLFISEATVNTHRRNLRSKLNAETPYDIIRFAQAFDLI